MLNSTAKGDLYITVKVEVPRKLNDQPERAARASFEESTTGQRVRGEKILF